MASARVRACLFVSAMLGAAVAAGACRGTDAIAAPRRQLRVANAFGPLSQPLTSEYRQRLANVDVRSEAASDSEAVIAAVERGTVDLGVALADDAYLAYERRWSETDQSSTSALRGIALL